MKKTLLTLIFALISLPTFSGEDCDVCGPTFEGAPLSSNFSFSAITQATRYITHSGNNGYFPETLPNDPRKVFNSEAPNWLEAVGKLEVPHRSKDETNLCSISLVTDDLDKDSVIAVTAGHCLKFWKFEGQNPKGPAIITFTKKDGTKVVTSIEKVLDSSSSFGDYAIVKLSNKIPNKTIKPLMIADRGYRGEDGLGYLEFDEFTGGPGHSRPFGTVAGYSTDKSPTHGNKGKNLTYHEKCHLNGGQNYIKSTKCWTYPGASGGATVVTVDQGEYNDNVGVEHLFVGSIVGQHKGENKNAFITPLEYFREPLESALSKYMP